MLMLAHRPFVPTHPCRLDLVYHRSGPISLLTLVITLLDGHLYWRDLYELAEELGL